MVVVFFELVDATQMPLLIRPIIPYSISFSLFLPRKIGDLNIAIVGEMARATKLVALQFVRA